MAWRSLHKKMLLCALLALSVPTATTSQQAVGSENGWYPCSIATFAHEFRSDSEASGSGGEGDVSNASFPINETHKAAISEPSTQNQEVAQPECAQFVAPLFHSGNSTSSAKAQKQTIPLFVKRVLAIDNPKQAPNVWFIQGGPGASSVAMEGMMLAMYELTDGQVNVYTLDHRGTGRSSRLDCTAAQATTSGSPGGTTVLPSEFAFCSEDLQFQYGNDLSCFSITTAATDIAWLIDGLQSKQQVFVYGVSYGTAVVERLIHLNVPEITGYILDGVATSSGAGPAQNFEYFSTWDVDMGQTGDRFLDLCRNDTFCASKFGDKGAAQTMKDLYARVDKTSGSGPTKSTSECAMLASNLSNDPSEPLSYVLRVLFGSLLQDEAGRVLIPALLYRLDRCNKQDREVLTFFFNSTVPQLVQQQQHSSPYSSDLLYTLITFSELWETPPPPMEVIKARFTDQLMADGQMYNLLPFNCMYRLDYDSLACGELGMPQQPKAVRPIAYQRDKYWNTSATIPKHASVLLMNGMLDPQTNSRYAQLLYQTLQGSSRQKKLLLFDTAPHVVVNYGDTRQGATCGMQILTAFVQTGGDLSQLDTSCMKALPPLSFAVDPKLSESMLGTLDAYNGQLEPHKASQLESNRSQEANSVLATSTTSESSKYETLFIVFVTLFAISLVVIGVLLVQLRKLTHPKQRPQYGDVYRASTPTCAHNSNINV